MTPTPKTPKADPQVGLSHSIYNVRLASLPRKPRQQPASRFSLVIKPHPDQTPILPPHEAALLFHGVGDGVAPDVVHGAFALAAGDLQHFADEGVAFDVVEVAGVGAGELGVHAVGFELAGLEVDRKHVQVVVHEAAAGVVEAAGGAGDAELLYLGAGGVEELAGVVGGGAGGVVADADHVVAFAVHPGHLGFDAVALAVEPDVADAGVVLLVGDGDHLAEEGGAGGVDGVEHVEPDELGRGGAVGDVGALAVDDVNVEVLLDEGAAALVEGFPGLVRAIDLQVLDGLVEQGAGFARGGVFGRAGQPGKREGEAGGADTDEAG